MTPIQKELGITISQKEMLSDASKYGRVSDLIGEFYENTYLSANIISTIANEMITNGVKYSRKNSDIKIRTFKQKDNVLLLLMENVCTSKQASYLKNYIHKMALSDVDTLYFERVDFLMSNSTEDRAQLGLLSLIKDYECELDLQISDNLIVTTRIKIVGEKNETNL